MAKTQRDPAREQFWRDAIAAWRSSGLTVRAFCERRQLTETTFHHWRRELRRRAAAAPLTAPPAFVPVTVVAAESDPVHSIEVRCPSGHVVTVPGADAATLRELFQALAALAGETPC
ncbi:IS66 family insertion sequence element accessory protein TnpA [Limnoglobus roseus]|uniref:IS66 family insertion sequence element accessory protein TnpB n=1 Tax=Limnoglobus roseus TaxID=2598579 RepID=A0A5C1ADB1_9BACT|nr:IS66 family insertion sequence element accessory protein TnpB [Limnoglobus roseus]QEL16690.1 hypothetical protein PX52LOC_03653 [Limnoglobus roseus]